MIKLLNYISATTIRAFALITVKLSSSFKKKFWFVKDEIKKVTLRQINLPKNLIYSVIEIEDKRYFQHSGIDFYSIIRATYKNTSANRIEGASTIVQQLIRNITNEREIKASRKVKEIMLATLIDVEFSKIEIIFAYLETYRFGNSKGISELCENENYNVNLLSLADSAQIAARLKYPTINNSNYIKYLKRVRTIEKITTT